MKKKNLFLSMLVVAMLIASMTFGTIVALAEVEESECDRVFETTLSNILDNEGEDAGNVLVNKTLLYDITLEPFGYVYDFSLNELNGYAIVINTDGTYSAPEVFLDCESPYEGGSGQPIYVTQNTYISYADEQYIDIKSNLPIAEESIELLKKAACYANANAGYEVINETINFLYKSEDEHKMSKIYPAFVDTMIDNSCVPTAGANVIWFYDRFYDNLIPNFNPGKTIGSYFVYNTVQTAAVDQMAVTLSLDMGTNSTGVGTTIPEFENGMIEYCNRKGRSVGFNSCMTNGQFDYNKAKQEMINGRPTVLFLDNFNVTTMTSSATTENVTITYSIGTHSMTGFGYKTVTYTFGNNSTRTENYVAISSGIGDRYKGYLDINSYVTIDEVYGVNIF